ncbi:exodeoxyribonuclease VII large subunit [Parasporobacterium paucivorans]|uniref:Exodeoxyribonuclease 7 large subunit n=1 Tax=Parasporobacterium paucivorans DSM 15970 TaxID=1122934 RepID=A0A1M6FAY2_9FIRM|nr:exodeoxyribonuclease VII large subunit [Parasporobacterium paucivorans]SHI94918.1 Exodeoxyribonuclease VII large subunit [Parasporobacterium paucivorans DSM 15970]
MNNVYTVSQVNSYIKRIFTQDYALSNIYIKGEVSNCKYHSSGHIYFTLKDKSSVIAAVMFAGNRSGLSFRLEDGQTVIALGGINVYERDGKYQLYAKQILLDGAGILYQQYEELKTRLGEMGMFSEEYKKPIPAYALKVGIVTAKTGAAIQDIINVAKRRNPYVKLYLYPAKVQGEGAGASIVKGIETLDRVGLDTIIIGRGGGSIEDLWAFNEEIVARAIFNCQTPVISGVGHETDTTIADYVADMRAPTPSAACELAVFDYYGLEKNLSDAGYTMYKLLRDKLDRTRERLDNAGVRMKYLSPVNQIYQKKQYTADLETKLAERISRRIRETRHEIAISAEKLNGLSPLARLNKGYAFVTDESGKAIKSVENINTDDLVIIELQDGQITSKVTNITKRGEEYAKS